MKKLSYYAASFAVCCMMSAAFTSCVDETEEPDYVKQVRESEMKAEIAKNNAAALLNKDSDVYDEYIASKTAWEFAVSQVDKAKLNLTVVFTESIEDRIKQRGIQNDAIKSANDDIDNQASDASETVKAANQAKLEKATLDLAAYETDPFSASEPVFPLVFDDTEVFKFEDNVFIIVPKALKDDPSSWKRACGNYFACVKAEKEAKAIYDEKKAIYDATNTANN